MGRLGLVAVVAALCAVAGCGGGDESAGDLPSGGRATEVAVATPGGAVADPVSTQAGVDPTPTPTPTATAAPAATPGPTREELIERIKPSIVQTPVTYGAKRRSEMAKYSKRHYGTATAKLKNPKVIVVHYTVTPTFKAAFDIFDADAPDVELGERPGVCAHFLIDKDGTIHQLVPLSLRCRHTVGLNWTSIGIEHLGSSDADVIDRAVMRRASLRLVRWLQCRYGIERSDVIGHSESLRSPYHRENVAKLRTQTHADMQRGTMNRYRELLKACP